MLTIGAWVSSLAVSAFRYIEIDGRRYLWRDLVALGRAQRRPPSSSSPCSSCAKITGRRRGRPTAGEDAGVAQG
jgi:hypothetical protein